MLFVVPGRWVTDDGENLVDLLDCGEGVVGGGGGGPLVRWWWRLEKCVGNAPDVLEFQRLQEPCRTPISGVRLRRQASNIMTTSGCSLFRGG